MVGAEVGWWERNGEFAGLAAAFVLLILLRVGQGRLRRGGSGLPPSVQAQEGLKVTFEFSDDGYRITSDYFEGFQRWPGVYCILADETLIVFLISDIGHVLPVRALASADERASFLRWALDRLSPEARARSEVDGVAPSPN